MNVLVANLKHLYQRRSYWLIHLILGLLACWTIVTALGYTPLSLRHLLFSKDLELHPLAYPLVLIWLWREVRFMGPVLLALPIGIFAAMLPKQVLTKPFSYCLPGHRKVPGKSVLSVGIVTNMLGSLLFLMHPDLDGWQRGAVVCSAFGAGMTMYWLGVWYVWRPGIFIACMVFAIIASEIIPYVGMVALAERTIIEVPFEITVLGIVSSLAGWWSLAGKNHARLLCAMPSRGWQDLGSSDKVQKHRQSRAGRSREEATGYPRPLVDEFFLGRMSVCDHLGMGRHIWGGLYTTFAAALSKWKWNLVLLLSAYAFYLFFSYGPSSLVDYGDTLWFFLLPGFIVANLRLPVHPGMLTPQGRRERFVTAAIVAASIAALATAAIMIVTVISAFLARIIPEVEIWEGIYCKFHTLDTTRSCLLILAMPAALTVKLILHKRPALSRLSVYTLFFFAISIPGLWFILDGPIPIAVFVVSTWLVFAAVLWHFCMKRPLVGQGRTY